MSATPRGAGSNRPGVGDTLRNGLRLAVGTLTALPTAAPTRVDAPVAGWGMTLAPLAMLPLLLELTALVALGRWLALSPLVLAAVIVAALATSNRAIHLDGLADTCDGLTSGYDRERSLDVLKRGNIGPAGAAAITLTLIIEVAALAPLLASTPGVILAATTLLGSRHALAWGCRRGVPPARPGGLGSAVAGTVPGPRVVVALLILVGLATFSYVATGEVRTWPVATVLAAQVLAALIVLRRATTRFGGVTGDVLGAMVEVSLAVGLVVAAAVVAVPIAG